MRPRKAASITLAVSLVLTIAVMRLGGAEQAATTNSAVNADAMAWLRYVAEEVRRLRIEVLELRLEVQQGRAAELERGLAAAQNDRQRLEQEVSTYSQEILAIESQLAQPGLSADEQQQLFARKSELSAEMSGSLRQRHDSLAGQEAAARDRLDNQQRSIRAVMARRSELMPAGAQD